MANLFALVGIVAGALVIVACWLEARGRARYREGEHRREADVIRAERPR